MRLTDQGIRALSLSDSGQRDYHDDAVRGLALRVGTRTKSFVLIVRKGEQRRRISLGQYDPPHLTLAMAREKAKDILAAERLAKEPPAPRVTFSEALKTYYRVHVSRLRKASFRAITQTIDRHFKPKLGKKALLDIKPTDIAPLLDKMLDTPTEMHNAFVYLSMFLNWCMKRGYIETAPTARMQTPHKPPPRERTLTPDELRAVWLAADDSDYGRIIRLCLVSGQRIGQWAGARREYISGDLITWPAETMKGKRSHTLPLTPAIKTLLPDRVGFLFPTVNIRAFSNWSRSKARFDKTSGVQNWRHHDLRRTWSTVAADELGVEPPYIAAVLSHAYGTPISRVYNKARYIEPMRKALLAFEEWLQALLSNEENADGRDIQRLHPAGT